MPRVHALFVARRAPSLAVLALACLGVAGCSSDSSRFNSNPFASRSSNEVTGSAQARPTTQLQASALPPAVSAPQSLPAHQAGVQTAGGGSGLGSYHPPQAATTTASVPAGSSWQSPGGIPIIVGTSDTIDVLAKRYNVSSDSILRANNMSSGRMLQPGQRLIIPRSNIAATRAPAIAAPATQRVATRAPAGGTVHTVQSGDTLMSLSRRYKVSLSDIANANAHLSTRSHLKIGDKVTIPGAHAAVAQTETRAPVAAPAPTPAPQQVASAERPQQARLASTQTDNPAAAPAVVKEAEATGGLPSFRWPVRGRVISAYGAKTNGKSNDGINLSVPVGTPIKAAEDGVVAYAGNELKGYGNLVLLRHASGYVTAYAHASEIAVKRGDAVKRGQVIGKAGQTGDVSAPQLHFEIRKGSTPVDPSQFLNGA